MNNIYQPHTFGERWTGYIGLEQDSCACSVNRSTSQLTTRGDSHGGQRELGLEELCLQNGLLELEQFLLLELLRLPQFDLLLLNEADLSHLTPKTGVVGEVGVWG